MSFRTPLPVYVTRTDAYGETATYSLSAWMSLVALHLVWMNVVVWSLIGLYTAARLVL